MNILISNENQIAPGDFATIVKATQIAASDFMDKWGKPAVTLTQDATLPFDMRVRITNQFRHQGASGYHTTENGIPVSNVLPGTPYNRFGIYRKAWIVRGKQILPESFRPGTLTTVIHEVLEALVDPNNDRYSMPDSQGQRVAHGGW